MTKKTKKRYYREQEVVWVHELKKEATVKSIDIPNKDVVVEIDGDLKTLKLWEIDKLKYKAKDKFFKDNPEKIKRKKKKVHISKALSKSTLAKGHLELEQARVQLVFPAMNMNTTPQDVAKPIKKTYFSSFKGGVIPTKTEENAGRDCYARLEPITRDGKQVYELRLPQLKLTKIPLGFASYLQLDDVLSLKHERSSVGGTGLINVSGLIDSTYQGEVILQVVPLVADVVITSEVEEKHFDEATNTYFVPYSKAIAQAVVFKLSDAVDEHVPYEELLSKPSTRGTGGWGSSGK